VWLDLGALGSLTRYDDGDDWQDHWMGLIRTIMHREGLPTEVVSVRNAKTWDDVTRQLWDYDVLLMNAQRYNFDIALKSVGIFKQVNFRGQVFIGGMHTMVSPEMVETCPEFDRIGMAESDRNDHIRIAQCDLAKYTHELAIAFVSDCHSSQNTGYRCPGCLSTNAERGLWNFKT
jgi:hypothetical protein